MKAKKPSYAALKKRTAQLDLVVDGLREYVLRLETQHKQELAVVQVKLGAARMDAGIRLISVIGQSVEASARVHDTLAKVAAGLTNSGQAF